MVEVVHIIDSHSSADMLDQMLALRLDCERVISLGRPPAYARLGGVKSLHKPFGLESLAARRLAGRLPGGCVIHLWSARAIEAGCSAGRRIGGKVVLSLPYLPPPKTRESIAWEVGQFGHTLTVPTDQARQELIALRTAGDHVAVLPPSAHPPSDAPARRRRVRAELGLPDDEFLMVVSAEMVRGAGHKWASWAHAIVRKIMDRGRLLFPGGGALEDTVRFFANTTGYIEEVYFTGDRFSRGDVLSASDAALFFYERDCGLGGVAEAMLAALPIAASRTEDLSAICRHEQTALLVAPGDPRTTSAAVLRLIDDPALARRLGQNALQYAKENFLADTNRRRLDEIYATCA